MDLDKVRLWQPYAYLRNGKISHYYVYTRKTDEYIYYLCFNVAEKTYFSTNVPITDDTHPLYSITDLPLTIKEFIKAVFEFKKEK
jgi:hypothetical protein